MSIDMNVLKNPISWDLPHRQLERKILPPDPASVREILDRLAPRKDLKAGNATIVDVSVLHSGETLWVRPVRSDGSSALGGIVTDPIPGVTYSVNGGPTVALTDCIYSQGMTGVVYCLNPNRVRMVIDDSYPGWTSTGTWVEHNTFSGVGGYFSNWSVKNGQFRTSALGTCTWTFTGLVPGRYRVSAHLWDMVGPDRTPSALYTFRDGAGTTLATYTKNLTTTLSPGFDRQIDYMMVHDIGLVTLGAGQSTITVTLSNSGSGLLVADALTLISEFVPVASPGDTMMVHFPAGTLTVWGETTNDATIAANFLTDVDFCCPIDPPASRILKPGENLDGMRQGWFSVYLADRGLGNDAWGGNVTFDSHYNMTSNSGTVHRTMTYYPVSDSGLTVRGLDPMPEGDLKVEFDVSGVPFDATAQSATGLASYDAGGAPMPSQATFGAKSFTSLGVNPASGRDRWRLTQSWKRPTWSPIATRTADFSLFMSQGIQFVTNQAGLVITNWKWYGPEVPVGYTGTANPDEVARMKDAKLVFRSMQWLSTNFSPVAEPGDFMSTLDQIATPGGAPTPSGNPEYLTWSGTLLSIRPADLTGADTDDVFKRFPVSGYDCFYVATFSSSVSDFRNGLSFLIRTSSSTEFPSTIPGYTVQYGTMWGAFKITGKPNELVVACLASNPPYDTSSGQRATLDATHSLTAATGQTSKAGLLPYETFLDYCNDLDGEPWINVPHAASDALIFWMARTAKSRTPVNRRIHVEYSNEAWNAGYVQFHYFGHMQQYSNYLHSVDPVTYPFTYATANNWIAHQFGHVFKIFRSVWAEGPDVRDPALVVRHLCALTQNYGVTTQYMDQCVIEGKSNIDFDYLGLDNYQDKDPPGFQLQFPLGEAATAARLTPNGMLDVLSASTFHGIRHLWSQGHLDRVHAIAGYEDKLLSGYEGGWSYIPIDRKGSLSRYNTYEMMSSPRMFLITAAKMSYYQLIGFRITNKYQLAYYTIPGNPEGIAWSDLYTNQAALGTGSPSENLNPYIYASTACQPLGGRVAWASGHEFTTVTPPPGVGYLTLSMPSGHLRINVG